MRFWQQDSFQGFSITIFSTSFRNAVAEGNYVCPVSGISHGENVWKSPTPVKIKLFTTGCTGTLLSIDRRFPGCVRPVNPSA